MHVSLDRAGSIPLTEQLFTQVKRLIVSGALVAGGRLPSSRALAEELGVSRTVTFQAYDRLLAEGYVTASRGAGTYVAPGVAIPRSGGRSRSRNRMPPRRIGFEPLRNDLIDFRTGVPDLHFFPIATWQRLQREVWSALTPRDLAYSAPEGRIELRDAISGYLRVQRGVQCDPDQIVISSGTTQAISLLSSALSSGSKTARAAVEEPVTSDIPLIMARSGVTALHVPVDTEGISPAHLSKLDGIRFVYVTPSHHYPLGISMPASRRASLIETARHLNAYLVEDDYDSELRYGLPPVSTLHELDPARVAYIGTFSKTLAPALRAAFLVLPWEIVAEVRKAKWQSDLHNASPEQLVLARFVAEGYYVRHIAAMRRLYARKWSVLERALSGAFGASAEVLGSPAGIHVAVRFPGERFDLDRLRDLESRGVKFYPVSQHAFRPSQWLDCLVIGFGHLDEKAIEKGISVLGHALAHR